MTDSAVFFAAAVAARVGRAYGVVMDPLGRKPPWLRVRAPGGDAYHRVRDTLRALELHTVCEHARCPNVGACWRDGTATVMLLGDVCTRGCRFCAVAAGHPSGDVDRDEPERVARAIAQLDLRYVVLTMVTRDDLPDGGATIVADTIERVHDLRPGMLVEALVSDFGGDADALHTVVSARPDVLGHNVEVVRRWTGPIRDRRCSYEQSLELLARVERFAPEMPTKSSLMVGVGETDGEVSEALRDLRSAGVELLTIGQYLCPTPKHHPVHRYVTPDSFAAYADEARALGFAYVASAPLVRSSYRAAESFIRSRLQPARRGGAAEAAAAGPAER